MEDLSEYVNAPDRKILLRNTPVSDEDKLVLLPSREEKLRSIAASINSLAEHKKPDNLFIYGKGGTGKTAHIQHLLFRLQSSKTIVPVYVNCHEHQTRMAIFHRIASELDNSFSRRGFASYEVFGRIREITQKEKKSVLLVLDDVEALINSDACELFYPIIEENGSMSSSFGIIAISNDFRSFEALDPKIKSSFMFRILEFESHGKDEIERILVSVAARMLMQDSYNKDILGRVAELSEDNVDNARFAIWLLLATAKNAEQRNSNKIEMFDVITVYEQLLPLPSCKGHSGLSREELLIIAILKSGEKTSTAVYELFQKRMNKSKRQIRNYLGSLVKKDIVQAKEIESDKYFLRGKVYKLKKR